jgi:protein phosphatase
VEVVVDYFRTSSWFNPTETLDAAVREANRAVYDLGTGHGEATRSLMGTTLVAALVHDRTGQCWIANVGDSRAYLYRDGRLEQITQDHSLVAERERAGLITAEEARRSESRNVITRAIGPDPEVEPDVLELPSPLGPNDLLLLCSDGLHGMIDDVAIARVVARTAPPSIPHQLIAAANRAGGRDNITVVLGGQSVPANADGSLRETLVEKETSSRAMRRKPSLSILLAGVVGLGIILGALAATRGPLSSEKPEAQAHGESDGTRLAQRTPAGDRTATDGPALVVPGAATPPSSVVIGLRRRLVLTKAGDKCQDLALGGLPVGTGMDEFVKALGSLNPVGLNAKCTNLPSGRPMLVPSVAEILNRPSIEQECEIVDFGLGGPGASPEVTGTELVLTAAFDTGTNSIYADPDLGEFKFVAVIELPTRPGSRTVGKSKEADGASCWKLLSGTKGTVQIRIELVNPPKVIRAGRIEIP